MILLADGGSTKVDWCLTENKKVQKRFTTKGVNPYFRTQEDISEEIKNILVPELEGSVVDSVYFFGAGCNTAEKNNIIQNAIAENIEANHIEIDTDLLGAAKGLFGNTEGIACILGTGSNSCYYNGTTIVDNVSPLGYILGDEGSGAVLGRLFVGACLKNQLTPGLKEKFLTKYNLTPISILDKVYKQPIANRFLAGLSPFILDNIEDQTVSNLVSNAFNDFFVKNVMQYKDWDSRDVSFVGSVAYYYQSILRNTAEKLGVKVGNIVQSPIEGLIRILG